MKEIPYSEFLQDIRQQKRRAVEKPEKKPWEIHPQALNREEYDRLTEHGRHRLDRPRPVWLGDKERWTVGVPVNPIEWQILIQPEPTRGRNFLNEIDVAMTMRTVCGYFEIHRNTFSWCQNRLYDRRLLKYGSGSGKTNKWLFPDLTGQRAGGEWHRRFIHDFVEKVNRKYGCYTYVDRGLYPGVEMPDVIVVRPRLVRHTRYSEPQTEPLEWDMERPVYAEFKSAVDMRNNPGRLEEQLDRYVRIPLYLQVEARVGRVKDMLEERGKREVHALDLLENPVNDMVCLTGSERPRAEWFFDPVLKRIKQAFLETYDKKARLKKTGVDPQGRECHDLILYDALNTPKNVGQVIPNYADDVEDFVDLFFDWAYLGRITTADYIYTPERKPTRENKTWKWDRSKTKGARFRSFSS